MRFLHYFPQLWDFFPNYKTSSLSFVIILNQPGSELLFKYYVHNSVTGNLYELVDVPHDN